MAKADKTSSVTGNTITYNFLGWNTDPKASVALYEPGDDAPTPDTNITLYPIFSSNDPEADTNTIVIQFSLGTVYSNATGTLPDTIYGEKGETWYVPATSLSLAETSDNDTITTYNFEGWSTNPGATAAQFRMGTA
jgi:hypothetical protein